MKRLSALIVLALLCLVAAPSSSAQTSSPRAADACESCHADFSSVLPKEHPAVKENGLAACLQCHSIGQAGEAKKNGFSTRIHLTHGGPKLHMECTACHTYVAGKSFGLIGQSNSWGRRKTATWPQSSRSSTPGQTPAIPTICTPRLWLTVRDATAKRCLYRARPSRIAVAWFAMVLRSNSPTRARRRTSRNAIPTDRTSTKSHAPSAIMHTRKPRCTVWTATEIST